MAIISLIAVSRLPRPATVGTGPKPLDFGSPEKWLRLVPWILLVFFMAKVGTFQNARQLAPYYVLLFPALLTRHGIANLPWKRWWRVLAVAVMLTTVLLVIGSRIRPMFPAQTLFAKLQAHHPQSKVLSTFVMIFGFRSSYEDVRTFLAKDLPSDGSTVGYQAAYGGTVEPAIWVPLGRLKVQRFLPADNRDQMQSAGIRFVVFDDFLLEKRNQTVAQWAAQFHARLVDQLTFLFNPHVAPNHLYIFELKPDAAD